MQALRVQDRVNKTKIDKDLIQKVHVHILRCIPFHNSHDVPFYIFFFKFSEHKDKVIHHALKQNALHRACIRDSTCAVHYIIHMWYDSDYHNLNTQYSWQISSSGDLLQRKKILRLIFQSVRIIMFMIPLLWFIIMYSYYNWEILRNFQFQEIASATCKRTAHSQ